MWDSSNPSSSVTEDDEDDDVDSFYDAPETMNPNPAILALATDTTSKSGTLTDRFSTCRTDTLKAFLEDSRREIDTESNQSYRSNDHLPLESEEDFSEKGTGIEDLSGNFSNFSEEAPNSESDDHRTDFPVKDRRLSKPATLELKIENEPINPFDFGVSPAAINGAKSWSDLGKASDVDMASPPSDKVAYLDLPDHSPVAGKSNSLPYNINRNVSGARDGSQCDLFKMLDKTGAPTNTEESLSDGDNQSESTNTTQETKSSKFFRGTPRKLISKIKHRGGTKSRPESYSGADGSSGGGGATGTSGVDTSAIDKGFTSYHSDNFPDNKKIFCDSKLVQTIDGKESCLAIWCLKFSFCGKYLAAAGQDSHIRIWVLRSEYDKLTSIQGGQGANQTTRNNSTSNIHNLAYSQKSIEDITRENSLKSDDSLNETCFPFVREPYRSFKNHSSDVMDISWSHGTSNFLLSASMDKSVRLWQVHLNKCLGAFDHQALVTCVTFPPKDMGKNTFASGAMDGKVRVWSITQKKVIQVYEAQAFRGKKQPITCITYNSTGDKILVGTHRGNVLKLDTTQLSLVSEWNLSSTKIRRSNTKIVSIQERPKCPDSFLVCSNDCKIQLFDMSAPHEKEKLPVSGNQHFWKLKAKYKGHTNKNSPIRVGFSRLGNYIISGSECKGVFIWSTENLDAKPKSTSFECIHAHGSSVTAATFCPEPAAIDCLDELEKKRAAKQTLTATPATPEDCISASPCTDLEPPSDASNGGCPSPKHRSGSANSQDFTVKHLVLGEVFASADYTGKINIFFA